MNTWIMNQEEYNEFLDKNFPYHICGAYTITSLFGSNNKYILESHLSEKDFDFNWGSYNHKHKNPDKSKHKYKPRMEIVGILMEFQNNTINGLKLLEQWAIEEGVDSDLLNGNIEYIELETKLNLLNTILERIKK